MNGRLVIGILLDSGIILIAGVFLLYLGFLSPIFRRSSEGLAPDRWVGTFRVIARIVGAVLCIIAGFKIFSDIRQASVFQTLQWREITSREGRFRLRAPVDLVEEVRDVPYGEQRVRESCFRGTVPTLGFSVSYTDLPPAVLKAEADKVLNSELKALAQVTGVILLNKESTRFAGCPAIRFKLHYVRGGYFVEGILLLDKQRRYQLAVQFTNESSAQNCEPFFEKFQVLDGP
jgi:hypothetical protein